MKKTGGLVPPSLQARFVQHFHHDPQDLQHLLHLNEATAEVVSRLRQKIIDGCRHRFEETSNPLWVWFCIDDLREFAAACAGCEKTMVAKAGVTPLPDWIVNYLIGAAAGISEIVTKLPPVRRRGPDPAGKRPKLLGKSDATYAVDDVAKALGLRRIGWNPFIEVKRDLAEAKIVSAGDILEHSTVEIATKFKAMSQIPEEQPRDADLSASTRRVSRARKLAGISRKKVQKVR